jgi:hypothetical protein
VYALPTTQYLYEDQTWSLPTPTAQAAVDTTGIATVSNTAGFLNIKPLEHSWSNYYGQGLPAMSIPAGEGSTDAPPLYADGSSIQLGSNVIPNIPHAAANPGTYPLLVQHTQPVILFDNTYTPFTVTLNVQEVTDRFELNTSAINPLQLQISNPGNYILPILSIATGTIDGMQDQPGLTPYVGLDNETGNEADLLITSLSVTATATNPTDSVNYLANPSSLFSITPDGRMINFTELPGTYGVYTVTYNVVDRRPGYTPLGPLTGVVQIYSDVDALIDPMTGGATVRASSAIPASFTLGAPSSAAAPIGQAPGATSDDLFQRSINSIFPDGTEVSGVHAYYILRTTACYFIPGSTSLQNYNPVCDDGTTGAPLIINGQPVAPSGTLPVADCVQTQTQNLGGGSTFASTTLGGATQTFNTNDVLVLGIEQRCVLNNYCNYYSLVPMNIACAVANGTNFASQVGTVVDVFGPSSALTCVKLPCPNRTVNCTD